MEFVGERLDEDGRALPPGSARGGAERIMEPIGASAG
jgi:hypothetical protein